MKRVLSVVMIILISVSAISIKTTAFASAIATTAITSLKTKNKTITVKWKKKTGITGYQIQYSTNSKFKKNNKKIKIKNSKTVSKKITGLNPTQKYYVRIRTYKGKKYSSWSKKKCITTKSSTPISAATTTAQTRCTNNNNHSMSCGNIGRWFNSRSDIETYWKNQCNALAEKWDKGEISDSEYYSKSPYGYECWSCSYCGKWTGNFKYR